MVKREREKDRKSNAYFPIVRRSICQIIIIIIILTNVRVRTRLLYVIINGWIRLRGGGIDWLGCEIDCEWEWMNENDRLIDRSIDKVKRSYPTIRIMMMMMMMNSTKNVFVIEFERILFIIIIIFLASGFHNNIILGHFYLITS